MNDSTNEKINNQKQYLLSASSHCGIKSCILYKIEIAYLRPYLWYIKTNAICPSIKQFEVLLLIVYQSFAILSVA